MRYRRLFVILLTCASTSAPAVRHGKAIGEQSFSSTGLVLDFNPALGKKKTPGTGTILCDGATGSVVITASHVVPDEASRDYVFFKCADAWDCVSHHARPEYKARTARVTAIHRLVSWRPDENGKIPVESSAADIALLKLDRRLSHEVVRLPQRPLAKKWLDAFVPGDVIGYGFTDKGIGLGQKRAGSLSAVEYDSDRIFRAGSLKGTDNALCHGDSGGPWGMRGRDGAFWIYGIASFALSFDDKGELVQDGSASPCGSARGAMAFYASTAHQIARLAAVLKRDEWCGAAAARELVSSADPRE